MDPEDTREREGSDDEATPLGPPSHTHKPRRRRGARMSKAEREARREARLSAAKQDEMGGELLEARMRRLEQMIEKGEWDLASTLAAQSHPLAQALLRALVPTGRVRLIEHAARKLATTVGVQPLLGLVDEAAEAGKGREAAALARGLLLPAHRAKAHANDFTPDVEVQHGIGSAADESRAPSCAWHGEDALAHDLDTDADAESLAAAGAELVARRFRFGGLHDLALSCFERGSVAEGAEIIGRRWPLQVAVLRLMLESRRCIGLAAQYLPALSGLPSPGIEGLRQLGAEACALLSTAPDAATKAERARTRVAEVLTSLWPGSAVHVYGSTAIGLSARTSDVDLCALIPGPSLGAYSPPLACDSTSHAATSGEHAPSEPFSFNVDSANSSQGNHATTPTPLTQAGRAALGPLLEQAADALTRALGRSIRGGVRQIPQARTPQLTFCLLIDDPKPSDVLGPLGMQEKTPVQIDLTLNNVSGLANTYIAAELVRRAPALGPAVAAMRAWARSKGLCGARAVPSSYAWFIMTAHVLQYRGGLPPINARCTPFDALLQQGAVDQDSWRSAAAAAVLDNPSASAGGAVAATPSSPGIEALGLVMKGTGLVSPQAPPRPAESDPHPARPERPAEPTGVGCAPVGMSQPCPTADSRPEDRLRAQLHESSGALVWHCLRHWAFAFPYRKLLVSLRDASLTKRRKGWSRKRDAALMIEDLTELDRDLALKIPRAALWSLRLAAASAVIRLADGTKGGSVGLLWQASISTGAFTSSQDITEQATSSPSSKAAPTPLASICEPIDWRLDEHARLLGPKPLKEAGLLASPASKPPHVVLVEDEMACTAMLSALVQERAISVIPVFENPNEPNDSVLASDVEHVSVGDGFMDSRHLSSISNWVGPLGRLSALVLYGAGHHRCYIIPYPVEPHLPLMTALFFASKPLKITHDCRRWAAFLSTKWPEHDAVPALLDTQAAFGELCRHAMYGRSTSPSAIQGAKLETTVRAPRPLPSPPRLNGEVLPLERLLSKFLPALFDATMRAGDSGAPPTDIQAEVSLRMASSVTASSPTSDPVTNLAMRPRRIQAAVRLAPLLLMLGGRLSVEAQLEDAKAAHAECLELRRTTREDGVAEQKKRVGMSDGSEEGGEATVVGTDRIGLSRDGAAMDGEASASREAASSVNHGPAKDLSMDLGICNDGHGDGHGGFSAIEAGGLHHAMLEASARYWLAPNRLLRAINVEFPPIPASTLLEINSRALAVVSNISRHGILIRIYPTLIEHATKQGATTSSTDSKASALRVAAMYDSRDAFITPAEWFGPPLPPLGHHVSLGAVSARTACTHSWPRVGDSFLVRIIGTYQGPVAAGVLLASPHLQPLNGADTPAGLSAHEPTVRMATNGPPTAHPHASQPVGHLWARIYYVTPKRALLSLEAPRLARLKANDIIFHEVGISDAPYDKTRHVASERRATDGCTPSVGDVDSLSSGAGIENGRRLRQSPTRRSAPAAAPPDLTRLLSPGDLIQVMPIDNIAGTPLADSPFRARADHSSPHSRVGKDGGDQEKRMVQTTKIHVSALLDKRCLLTPHRQRPDTTGSAHNSNGGGVSNVETGTSSGSISNRSADDATGRAVGVPTRRDEDGHATCDGSQEGDMEDTEDLGFRGKRAWESDSEENEHHLSCSGWLTDDEDRQPSIDQGKRSQAHEQNKRQRAA